MGSKFEMSCLPMKKYATRIFANAWHRQLTGLLALWVSVFASSSFAQAACTFEKPESWATSTTSWVGDCKNGRAEGLGVVKEVDHGRVVRFFFGQLRSGKWVLGVIDQTDGYIAGNFLNEHVVEPTDRNTILQAFDEAAKAAQSVAERYRQKGNLPSAKFYQAKSTALKNQMD